MSRADEQQRQQQWIVWRDEPLRCDHAGFHAVGQQRNPRREQNEQAKFAGNDGARLWSKTQTQRAANTSRLEIESPARNVAAAAGAAHTAALPHNYVTEPQHRIEIYRKLAQANEKSALENLQKELRDRFGPLPLSVELLLAVGELKILASEKSVTAIEVNNDKLMLTRHGDFITLGGKFPRLTKKEAKTRLKEIKRLLLAI